MTDINRVVLCGRLTRDPELRSTGGGTSVCSMRLAVNGRRKNQSTGDWVDVPNYFDITVWGTQGENCAKYLAKGRPVAIDGRLQWREWTDKDDNKRQAVDVVAETVQFLSDGSGGNGRTTQSSAPTTSADFEAPGAGPFEATPAPAVPASDDEPIPF